MVMMMVVVMVMMMVVMLKLLLARISIVYIYLAEIFSAVTPINAFIVRRLILLLVVIVVVGDVVFAVEKRFVE